MNSEQKKFLDENGLKILWNQISMHDYPNNAALTSVINAIDANKADKADIPRVDTTLSAAGAAADAKAVGEAISKMEGTPGPQGEKGEKGDPGPQGLPGKDGVSGVYVGSGEMPAGYNIQIDPAGEAPVLVQSINGIKPDPSGNVEIELPDSGESEYTLPIATPDILGGVKPTAKSDDMTQSVGVDESGGLWTAPGTGSGETSSEEVVLVNYTAVEPISVVNIPFDEKMMEAINNAHMICWRLTLCGDETATDTTGEGSVEFGFWCAWQLTTLLKPTTGVPSAENKGWKVGNFNGYILKSSLFKREYIASSGGAIANTQNYDLCFENKGSDSITVRNVVAELPIARTDVVLRLTTSLPIGTGSRVILTAR